jgi:hypothetical protein
MYVVFIDYSKAYDRVPRKALLERLRDMGCGRVMLKAILSMYKITRNILGSAVITATTGVRQGSPTSCLLFTFYVNKMIRMLKTRCNHDGFLASFHCLMLMDDTVILATSRDKCLEKLQVVLDF